MPFLFWGNIFISYSVFFLQFFPFYHFLNISLNNIQTLTAPVPVPLGGVSPGSDPCNPYAAFSLFSSSYSTLGVLLVSGPIGVPRDLGGLVKVCDI